MRHLASGLALACIAMLGCTSVDAVTRKVSTRASFRPGLPVGAGGVVRLDDDLWGSGAYGATGCGKRISYNVACAAIGASLQIAAQAASDAVVREQGKQ